MLQQRVKSLNQENLNLQEKAKKDLQDLEKDYKENEQYGQCLCLRIRNKKKHKK